MKPKININLQDIENIEYVYMDKIKPYGNSAKISCPKKYIGREAIVIIRMEDPRIKDLSPELIKIKDEMMGDELEDYTKRYNKIKDKLNQI